jgi:uncharacterized protein involved in response to NO
MTLLGTGFRPFFLFGAAFGALSLAHWAATLLGAPVPLPRLAGTVGHGHELLLGYVGAVLAGFFLTAPQNWTGRTTATGPALAALVLLWLAGRLAAAVDLGLVGDALCAAFFPALAVVVGRPLLLARSWRNVGFVPLLLGLGAADAALHAGALPASAALRLALDAVIVIVLIVAGRITPLFTRNALPGSGARRVQALDLPALGLAWAVLAVDLVALAAPLPWLTGAVALAAGAANLARMGTWGGLATRRTPILWVLHVGTAAVALGLALRGAADLGATWLGGASLHLITVGGLGGLTVGMMSRVSLGHTGRPLVLPSGMVLGYGLVFAALGARLAGALVPARLGSALPAVLSAAALLLAAALGLFVVRYTRTLTGQRADGRPG